MKDTWLSVSEIKELMGALKQHDLSELSLKVGACELTLRQTHPEVHVVSHADGPTAVYTTPPQQAEPCPPAPGTIVKSPIVGTYYSSSAPGKPPFVKVGQHVQKGDVLFIIESMKLMNEVLCESEGTVAELFVQNEQAVEFGEPILRME